MSARRSGARRRARDPLQVSLRRVVYLIIFVVLLPTAVLTGLAIGVVASRNPSADLVLGILEIIFAVSVIAGAVLLIFVAVRGARLARAQDTFLSQMGHELLTPLSGIKLHTQILEAAEISEDLRPSLEAIRREADRLGDLVHRTLRWREIRSSRHLYRKTSTTAGAVIERVLRNLPEDEDLQVRILAGDARLRGDPDALAEAVGNLVQNARKYGGDAGPVELAVRKLGQAVVFVVSDRGPGLPKSGTASIFEPFHRVIPAGSVDPGGSGLGLSIARQIVRAHRGAINGITRRGGGARFFIHLPIEERS